MTVSLFSVAGGKFHRPAIEISAPYFRPTRTMCGCEVRPLNYYATDTDADSYTGGRLARFMCKNCRNKSDPTVI